MVAMANIVKIYADSDSANKVDMICKHYPNFIGIVDGYTEGLRYMIENEKKYNCKAAYGDLGVRVQSLGHYTDLTGDLAVDNVMTRDALISCDFSGGILEGTDRPEKYQKDAEILKWMRRDYDLFTQQLKYLPPEEHRIFVGYITKEKELTEIAEEFGVQYESIKQRLWRTRKKIKVQMIAYLDGTF